MLGWSSPGHLLPFCKDHLDLGAFARQPPPPRPGNAVTAQKQASIHVGVPIDAVFSFLCLEQLSLTFGAGLPHHPGLCYV